MEQMGAAPSAPIAAGGFLLMWDISGEVGFQGETANGLGYFCGERHR